MGNVIKNPEPILGFDEIFEDGIIVDGSDVSLEEVDNLMKQYFAKNNKIEYHGI